MSGAAGPGVLPGLRGGELATERPGRCVGPSRSGRGVRRPREKRRGAGTSRGRGGRRRARSSVRETRCVSAERLQDCRRPWGRRPAAGTAQAAGANEAAGTPGTAGSMEAARDLGTVWVNGAVGEPEVVGSVGSVWVTGTGEEEETAHRSPRGSAGASGPLVGDASSRGGSGVWGRRQAAEVPAAARASGPGDGETDSEGVAGLWRRRADGAVPGAVRVPLSLGVLAAVGVPTAGHQPAAVWVTGSAGEEPSAAVSSLTAGRRPSAEGLGAPGRETGGRSVLGLPGVVSYSCGHGTRLWSCPRSAGEELDSENVPGVSRTGTAGGVNEAEEVPPVSREETGIGHLRDHAQQGGRRQAAGGSRIRGRGNNLGENCEGEDRLRGAFQ
nr:collagen alpha-2(I) chain [Kogia breviceps]